AESGDLMYSNVKFDLYRGFNPSAPYACMAGPSVACGVDAELRHHIRCGRFGAGKYLHWTHLLLVDLPAMTKCGTVAIHSAYTSQFNSFDPGQADTIIIGDYPMPGFYCAWMVVDLQVDNRGQPGAFWRTYIDRARPRAGHKPACACKDGPPPPG